MIPCSLNFCLLDLPPFRSLINFLFLIIGFAFGFFIISHGKDGDHFENPVKAILKTLIMALGEFEFDDLYRLELQPIEKGSISCV